MTNKQIQSPCHPKKFEFKANSMIYKNVCVQRNNNLFYDNQITFIGTQNTKECLNIIKKIICQEKMFKHENSCQDNSHIVKFPIQTNIQFIVLYNLYLCIFFRHLVIFIFYLVLLTKLMMINTLKLTKNVNNFL